MVQNNISNQGNKLHADNGSSSQTNGKRKPVHDATITIRIPSELKRQLIELQTELDESAPGYAAVSLSSLVVSMIEDGLAKRGDK